MLSYTAWCWGDPHIRTVDGRRYTFNGLGEYIFANVNNIFETQARTKLAAENITATVFSAFAAADSAPDSDRVQVKHTLSHTLTHTHRHTYTHTHTHTCISINVHLHSIMHSDRVRLDLMERWW